VEDIDPRIVIPETGRAKRRLAAVLVLDVVGYSRHLAVDPDATLASMRSAYRSIVRPVVRAYAGRVVKLMGDGVLAEFPDAGGGLAAALDIQQALAAPVDPALRRRPLDLRAGLHLGEVLSQDGDIFGETVNIAVRLQASAKPGGVLMSWAVYERLNPPIAGRLVELGPLRLRHVDRPIHVVAAEIGPG
jgi:adenylate cyclase